MLIYVTIIMCVVSLAGAWFAYGETSASVTGLVCRMSPKSRMTLFLWCCKISQSDTHQLPSAVFFFLLLSFHLKSFIFISLPIFTYQKSSHFCHFFVIFVTWHMSVSGCCWHKHVQHGCSTLCFCLPFKLTSLRGRWNGVRSSSCSSWYHSIRSLTFTTTFEFRQLVRWWWPTDGGLPTLCPLLFTHRSRLRQPI